MHKHVSAARYEHRLFLKNYIVTVGQYRFASTVYGALHSVDNIVANMGLFVLQVARGCVGLLLFHSFS